MAIFTSLFELFLRKLFTKIQYASTKTKTESFMSKYAKSKFNELEIGIPDVFLIL